MKIYPIYLLQIVLFLNACDIDFRKKSNTVYHKRVYEITNPQISNIPLSTKKINVDTSYLEYVFKGYDLVNIRALDSSIHVSLRYADTNNFLKTNFYDGLRNAYFPCEVALRVCNAQYFLKQLNPELSLVIFDAARPLHIQKMMWDSLKMPNNRKFNYLSPPYETSLHNYGCAVDLGILDISQNLLKDMGCDFDTFEKIAQPFYEQKFLTSGELAPQAFQNRKLLRWVMKRAGFSPIPSEWWHFAYGNKTMAAAKFKLIH